MADFPTFEDDANRPRQPLGITPPAFDANASGTKTGAAVFVEQQWRDIVTNKTDDQHPLSINRDAPQVTDDPYTA